MPILSYCNQINFRPCYLPGEFRIRNSPAVSNLRALADLLPTPWVTCHFALFFFNQPMKRALIDMQRRFFKGDSNLQILHKAKMYLGKSVWTN